MSTPHKCAASGCERLLDNEMYPLCSECIITFFDWSYYDEDSVARGTRDYKEGAD